MMMIKTVIKSSACVFFPLTCFLLAVFSGLPVFAKIILEVTDRFFFFNFPKNIKSQRRATRRNPKRCGREEGGREA